MSIHIPTIKEGERYRGQCPFCGRYNTFTATKRSGIVIWNCYSASCGKRGKRYEGLSVSDIARENSSSTENISKPFSIPPSFIEDIPETAQRWLRVNGCTDAILQKRVDIRWDLKTERLVFLIKREGICYGAVGRKFSDSVRDPKWYRFDRSPFCFCCRYFNTNQRRYAAVVEDPASACNVSSIMDAYGILGTIISKLTLTELIKYDTVYIALDRDAISKAIMNYNILSSFVNTKILYPRDDPKYLSQEELNELFKEK